MEWRLPPEHPRSKSLAPNSHSPLLSGVSYTCHVFRHCNQMAPHPSHCHQQRSIVIKSHCFDHSSEQTTKKSRPHSCKWPITHGAGGHCSHDVSNNLVIVRPYVCEFTQPFQQSLLSNSAITPPLCQYVRLRHM